jgi:Amidohydrolase
MIGDQAGVGVHPACVDVHQHLWPGELVEALRGRRRPPYLDGWHLVLTSEPPCEIDPSDHDPAKRAARNADDGIDRALLSLSAPLGIEWLPGPESRALIDRWHAGALALGPAYGVWASACLSEVHEQALARALDEGCVGLQIPADAIATPDRLTALAGLLRVCEVRDKPVLVHPGAGTSGSAGDLPEWWAPVVDYVQQQVAAWWAWHAVGRSLLPTLRICFAAAGGLAAVHHERLTARGGRLGRLDPDAFVDTSSYGARGLDAVIRVLGIDVVVLGSDLPYCAPTDPGLGAAATHAIRRLNPRRLREGGRS